MEDFVYHDFTNHKFHPSQLGKLMTPAKSKGDLLGETCKSELLNIWIEETYGRKKDISNKYMEKGTLQEEESITLYSLVTKTFYKKNLEQVSNDFLVGTPDLYKGESIMTATEIKDIKTSWDIFTFFAVYAKAINPLYKWQMQGYMDITGAIDSGLIYCLVDTPLHLIEDEKRKLGWAMNIIDPQANPEYLAKCEQIEKNMTYSLDIPKEHRWVEFKLARDNGQIEEAHAKLIECRAFLNELNDTNTILEK